MTDPEITDDDASIREPEWIDQANPENARIRSAYHEAGHAVAAWRLGRDVLSVSLDPQGEHFGQVEHSTGSWDTAVSDWTVPIRGAVRDGMETDIIIALAGHIAEDYIGPRTGFGLRPDHEWAERAATVVATVSPRHQELAQRGEAVSADERFAKGSSYGLAGSEAVPHLAWLYAVSRRLVAESGPRIERLADALLAEPSRVMSVQRATAIIEGAEA